MKRLFVVILFNLLCSTILAQYHSIDNVEHKLEIYADSIKISNYAIVESFVYDLLNFISYIQIYGSESDKTINRFGNVIYTEYTKIVSNIRYDSLNTNLWELSVDFSSARSVIHLFRGFLIDLSNIYGGQYVDRLHKSAENSMNDTLINSEDWGSYKHSLLNTYNLYNYDLIERTYIDELQMYLLYDDINLFLDLYDSILTSNLKDIAKAQMAQDCYDILIDYHNPNMAQRILEIWNEYDDKAETHLYDYKERSRTKLGMLAYHQHNYPLAYYYSSWVDFVIQDKGKDIWRYFEDVNEFLRQLETRALVELNSETDFDLARRKALNYFEFADSLITDDVRCRNKSAASPSMCSVIYNQLASLYVSKGDYNAAEHIIKKSAAKDNGYFNLNTSIANANLLISIEKYASAKEILYRCLDNLSLSKYNLRSKLNVYRLLLSIEKELDNEEALSHIVEQYFKTEMEYYYKELSLQPSYQRKNYWENEFNLQYMSANAGHLASINSKCASTGYDAALFQKGLLLRFDAIEAFNVNNSGDAELVEAYRHWVECSEKEVPDSIRYAVAERYTDLYSMHPEFVTDIKHMSWKYIQTVLEPSEIAIEFIETYDSSNQGIYGAYLLKSEYEMPLYITLCKSETLKNLLKKTTKGGYYPDIYNPIAQGKVYDLIWSKIEPHLNGVSKIFFSPQGLLTQLNIEILTKQEGLSPLNQKYDMYRISSTALLLDDNSDGFYSSATLMGGIDYDIDLTSQQSTSNLTGSISTSRGGNKEWDPLPHTAIEVEGIEKLLQKKKVATKIYTDDMASEEFFKSMTYQSNSMIHIATHGFYFPFNEAQKWEYFINDNEERKYISPLKRSGLVLAGGNHAWLGEDIPEGVEDGIVSAHEIANMNLSDTELVVLSACQTGLGEISNEGVSGIQRAFKLAGVKTLVMSLWEVSDEATSIMMKSFYKNLTKGKSKRDSFNAAIQSVKKWNDNPYYWAAFIMLD